jgi:hypothetical protein
MAASCLHKRGPFKKGLVQGLWFRVQFGEDPEWLLPACTKEAHSRTERASTNRDRGGGALE